MSTYHTFVSEKSKSIQKSVKFTDNCMDGTLRDPAVFLIPIV